MHMRSGIRPDSGRDRQGLLCTATAHTGLGTQTRYTMHLAFWRDARFAGKAPNHEIAAVNAKRPDALVFGIATYTRWYVPGLFRK
jgi:hypothetical protein